MDVILSILHVIVFLSKYVKVKAIYRFFMFVLFFCLYFFSCVGFFYIYVINIQDKSTTSLM